MWRSRPHFPELLETRAPLVGPEMIADLAEDVASSTPSFLGELQGSLFFSADDGIHGRELWKTDGTAAGTKLVCDNVPGSRSSELGGFGRTMSAATPRDLFFQARDGSHGGELWATNGSAAGTRIVRDLYELGDSSPRDFVEMNGAVYFVANDSLYRTNGDGAETQPVYKDLWIGLGIGPSELTRVGSSLFFVADGRSASSALWQSDGTTAGTRRVLELQGAAAQLTAFNDGLVFSLSLGERQAIYRVNSAPVEEAIPLLEDARLRSDFVELRNSLYFLAEEKGGALRLWTTDGSPQGTRSVVLLAPGISSQAPIWLMVTRDRLFVGFTNSSQQSQLWASDGADAGTSVLLALEASDKRCLIPVACTIQRLVFAVSEGDALAGWASDGAKAGTQPLGVGIASGVGAAAVLEDTVYFCGRDANSGKELWRTDGTPQNTRLVKDIFPGNEGSYPERLTPSFDGLLWTDHVRQGDILHLNVAERQFRWAVRVGGGSSPSSEPFLEADGKIYYSWADRLLMSHRYGLSAWDHATGRSTRLINGFFSPPRQLTALDQRVYFVVRGEDDWTLWRTDGDPGSTQQVATLDRQPSFLVRYQDQLIVGLNKALWSTRGTPDDARLIARLTSKVTSAVAANDRLYVLAGVDLWRYDEKDGARLLAQNLPGGTESLPRELAFARGRLFFSADDGEHGYELWELDPSEPRPRLVGDLRPGAEGSAPNQLTAVADSLFFSASDGAQGVELWRTTGAGGETEQFDLRVGAEGSHPAELTRSGNRLFFSANDGKHGPELWAWPPVERR